MTRKMTEGSIAGHLILFSIPLILGNLFQLLYNAVDSVIVGRFAGEDALAAVGCANPVMNIVILGVSGICIGASVLMSQFFGAGEYGKLKRELSTVLLLGCVFSVLMLAAGLLCSERILIWLQVPDEILGTAKVYLRIIFFGMPFTFFYNAVAAALRSVGDAKTPVYFLAAASVLNAGLDLLFVVGFHWGAAGAGLATVIAEAVSVFLCVCYIRRRVPSLRLGREDMGVDGELLKLTIQQGSITALQQCCQPIGKLLIQGKINTLGVSTIAAFNAVSRVDDFAFTPEQSIASAIMTFVAQNRGAGKRERVRNGFRIGLLLEAGYWLLICTAVLFGRQAVMELFAAGEDAAMVPMGVSYLSLMAFFYLFPAFTNGIQGFFRGMGNMSITLISTLIQISFRVIFVYALVPRMGIDGVAYASLIGWIFMLAAEVPYYFWFKRKR